MSIGQGGRVPKSLIYKGLTDLGTKLGEIM